jgi:hypothetical protein
MALANGMVDDGLRFVLSDQFRLLIPVHAPGLVDYDQIGNRI